MYSEVSDSLGGTYSAWRSRLLVQTAACYRTIISIYFLQRQINIDAYRSFFFFQYLYLAMVAKDAAISVLNPQKGVVGLIYASQSLCLSAQPDTRSILRSLFILTLHLSRASSTDLIQALCNLGLHFGRMGTCGRQGL